MSGTNRLLTTIGLAAVALAACTKKEGPAPAVEEPKAAIYVPPPEPARAAFTPKADTSYKLVGRKSTKCLQFAGAGENDGANAELWDCNGTDAQSFQFKPVAGGYFTIVSVRSKKCLDVANVSTDDGAGVQQFACNDGQNQQWFVADGTNGALRITARHSGKVLDAANEEDANGTHVNQWTWKTAPHQEFTIVPIPAAAQTAANGGAAGTGKPGKTGALAKASKKEKEKH